MDPEPKKIPEIEAWLEHNKSQMRTILRKAPIAGVYEGEGQEEWDKFFAFYINFLNSEIGPRGECTRAVREELAQKPQYYDEVLGLLQLNHKHRIRDIYTRYKIFSPSPYYDKLIKVQQTLSKSVENYKKICDQNSIMFNKIKQGMLSKRGEDYDFLQEIKNIRTNYEAKINKLETDEKDLLSILDQTEQYVRYLKLRAVMQPYFEQWKEADSRIGQESVCKGSKFEQIVLKKAIPTIIKRANIKENKYEVFTNCRWQDKGVGEIDIAVGIQTEEKVWEICVLIECKSRLFDLREAAKQVKVDDFKQKNKIQLYTRKGPLNISNNAISFIVTTLPDHQFALPFESKMKEALQRAGKNKTIEEMDSKQVYKSVKQKFEAELSPLDWFEKNDSQHILVLKYEN